MKLMLTLFSILLKKWFASKFRSCTRNSFRNFE